ncbi:ethanolamine ammonia-lyase subunit EutC [Nocardia cyriacigeorgica]|uniref:ethanolamine ammonia-lyase subunit EutC n=1 Tax=Nocardia cyriacigeorgica TaxID=135487 RepID=UPI002457ED33|nr:ethanolamine ammonia-lyase subunit EutC [Nocardia cyriacigeorgica]BDU07490.1 hypothetical protein FMUBM48_37530 [Nocardia cyriacigeorgica]
MSGPASDPAAQQEFWAALRATTQARIGLGRAGNALPTARVLELRAAHAAARDAVHMPLDVERLRAEVAACGLGVPALVRSRARDRPEYLRRPDLGRLPAEPWLPGSAGEPWPPGSADETVPSRSAAEPWPPESADEPWRPESANEQWPPEPAADTVPLCSAAAPRPPGSAGETGGAEALPRDTRAEIGIVLADGLSPRALLDHGPAMVTALVAELGPTVTFAPPVIATQARVALGDHIATALGVDTVLVLIGERPGLSVADSLGIYLTHRPRPGRTDAERNCVSNIHRNGLGYRQAARVVAGLIAGARRLGRSGVDLKDLSGADLTAAEHDPLTRAHD